MVKWTLESTQQPIGVSEYRISEILPAEVASDLPSIADIESSIAFSDGAVMEGIRTKGQTGGPSGGPNGNIQTTRQRILYTLAISPRITTRELATKLGVNRSVILKQIRQMKSSGQLKRVGSTQNGHWEVIQSEPEVN